MNTFSLLILLPFVSLCSDTFKENLDVHILPNNHFLSNFTYKYELMYSSDVTRIDYFPIQIFKFLSDTPMITKVEVDLVQGRWQENVMK